MKRWREKSTKQEERKKGDDAWGLRLGLRMIKHNRPHKRADGTRKNLFEPSRDIP
jgi:hypothetical protein